MKTLSLTIVLMTLMLWPNVEAQAQGRGADREAEPGEPSSDDEATQDGAAAGGALRRSNRMEFDTRLVRGETAGTGAVVLFNRGARRLPELIERRREFLRPTIEEVMGRRARAGEETSAPATPAAEVEEPEQARASENPRRGRAQPRARRRSRSSRSGDSPEPAPRPVGRGGR